MAIVRLTATAWLNRESERVKGIMICNLTRDGMNVNDLLGMIEMAGLHYTGPELLLIRARLVTDGVIEIV